MIRHDPRPRGSAQLISSQFQVNTAASVTQQNQLSCQPPNSSVNNQILSIMTIMQQKLSELEEKQQPSSATASVFESQVPVSPVQNVFDMPTLPILNQHSINSSAQEYSMNSL